MSRRLNLASICVFGLALAVATTAAPGDFEQRSTQLDQALCNRDYAAALTAADASLAAAVESEREYALYRRGLALYYAQRYDDALRQFSEQLTAFPNGIWAVKTRFRQADCHVGKRDYAAAERIYAEQIRRLLGDERKAHIAELYLDFAGEYFKPTDPLTQPDYAKAARFYDLALELEPGAVLRDELVYQRARCAQMQEQYPDAITRYHVYLLQFDPDYRAAVDLNTLDAPLPNAAVAPGKHILQARFNRAACLLASGPAGAARRALQDLVVRLDLIDADQNAHADLWIETHYQLARTYGFPTPPTDGDLTLGLAPLQTLIARFPERARAIDAAFDIGRAFAQRGRSDEAIAAYRALVDQEQIRPDDAETRELAEQHAQQALFTIGSLHRSQKRYAEAIAAWQEYLGKFPTGPSWSACQQQILETEYQIGADAMQEEKYDDARAAWQAFLTKYPLDPRAPQILVEFGNMAYAEQQQRVDVGEEPDWTIPLEIWRRAVHKYPGQEATGSAQFRIAATLEHRVHDLDQAIEAYRKLNWSEWADDAQTRIAQMRSTQLNVFTERTFRTDETPKIRVDTRNVDTLTVKLYRIDLEDYFRKTHVIGGIEQLDLLLIDPDKTLELPVPEFARFKPITQQLELPFDGPGVYAVMVTNENTKLTARDEFNLRKLQATTLLIRSDIDVIIKTSRRAVFVFAQNMRTNQPAPDVQVLVSAGDEVILEGTTGKDGVWRSKSDKLEKAQHLAVLAGRDGNFAGNLLMLSDLNLPTGLTPKGYVYTDRPIYQPGDAVNIRGILRNVTGGEYTLFEQPDDQRQEWKLDVVDPKGRTLVTETIPLNAFGTFATQFRVTPDAPTGQYRLIARRPKMPSFQGQFRVATYQLPKAFLSVEFDQRTVLRGEKITGRILAKYHYGQPVIDKIIRYQLQDATGDALSRSGKTDRDGAVAFEFETTRFAEEALVALHARQAELDIATRDFAYIAIHDFTAKVATPHELYLSDEPVEVTVMTEDLQEKPIGREMTLTASLRTYEHNVWTETRAEQVKVTTDSKTGRGTASLKLAKGGVYILRAEGADRFGHTVTADATVSISDADDQTRVRIFSDRQTYRVGETIDVDIHSRFGAPTATEDKAAESTEAGAKPDRQCSERPTLALITYEGEGIIGYRTQRLTPGHNRLDLPVEHAHFPNFQLSVDVMAASKLHSAHRDFQVERELNISLTPDRETYTPRDEVELKVEVTDQQGQPVSAEIGLAMIDQAVLKRFPDQTPDIVTFFQAGARRDARTCRRTETSCTFRYQARTTGLVTELLAEEERIRDEMAAGSIAVNASSILVTMNDSSAEADQIIRSLDRAPQETRRDTELAQQMRLRLQAENADQFGQTNDLAWQVQDLMPQSGQAGGGGRRRGRHSRHAGIRAGEQLATESAGPADASRPQSASFGVQHRYGGLEAQSKIADLNRGFAAGDYYFGYEVKTPQSMRQAQERYDEALGQAIHGAPARSYYPELAYWNPHVVTDEQGHATVRIILPDNSTTWKLIARGVTAETLVGTGEAEVLSRETYFLELLAPRTVMQGDTIRPTARVHCLDPIQGEMMVQLDAFAEATPDAKPELIQTLQIGIKTNGTGVYEVTFEPLECRAAGELTLSVQAIAPPTFGDADSSAPLASLAHRMTVRPWGMRIEAHTAGRATDTEFVAIELPGDASGYHDLRMTVAVGTSMPRWLLDEALETGPRWTGIEEAYVSRSIAPPRTHADTASSLLGCLYALDFLDANQQQFGDGVETSHAALQDRINGLSAQLLAAQRDDGAWPWCGGADHHPDAWTSSQVAWALGKARDLGQPVAAEALQRLANYLKQSFAAAPPNLTELKATLLHGLAWIDEVDFAHLNRLHRNRNTLSNAALAQLALTFLRVERKESAGEVVALLTQRTEHVAAPGRPDAGPTAARLPNTDGSAFMNSDLEITALTLLATLQVDPRNALVEPYVEYLAGAARVTGWQPHKARGAAIAGLSTYYARSAAEAANFTLAIEANDKPLAKVKSSDGSALRFAVPAELLSDGSQRVRFNYAGRGEYAYAVTLSAFSPEYPPEGGSASDRLRMRRRRVDPPPQEYKGRVVQAGYNVTRHYRRFENDVRHANVGDVISAQVVFWRTTDATTPAGDREYVIIQETIPAGFRLLTETVGGSHVAFTYSDNVLTAYYGSQHGIGPLYYQLVATTPGAYRMPPTILRSLYDPARMLVNRADERLTVLQRGVDNPDTYRLTPDELYHLGRLNFEDGMNDAARGLLRELLDHDWVLHDEPYRETVRMLLNVALRQDNATEVVDYFEILKEKHPDLVIPFEQIVQVAQAYAKTDQHERAYLIERAVADASFLADTGVGGALDQEGYFLDSIDLLEDLWREYPDTPEVQNVFFALSQALYGRADSAGTLRARRYGVEKDVDAPDAPTVKIRRQDMIAETIALLQRFLTLYPENPIADEASYSLANAYLDLDAFETVIAKAAAFVRRFPDSKWQDRFRYIQALALFHLARFDDARDLARLVAEATYRDAHGVERPSPNKWLALYIIGQIYHAQGRTPDALEFYRKVREQYADADEAISYFEQKRIELPEVTIFHPDDDGFREADAWLEAMHKQRTADPDAAAAQTAAAPLCESPFVQIDYRNIANVVLQVYRVDLMRLALLEKNLAQVTAVNLAGVRPILERTITLGDGHDYVDKAVRVDLAADAAGNLDVAAIHEPGAYLVICRGDNLFASGLVLVTSLALDVRYDDEARRARVHVVDAITRDPLREVHVKAIGNRMDKFITGETDLRGVFVADDVIGDPTVLARLGESQFAFHRAPVVIAPPPPPAAPPQTERPQRGRKADYRENLQRENRQLQMMNEQRLEEIMKQPQQRGVQIQKAQ